MAGDLFGAAAGEPDLARGAAVTPVIIVFGAAVRPDGSPSGAMRYRTDAALTTGRHLTDPRYLVTGGQGRYGKPEAEVMADLLESGGVARARIIVEPTGRNTIRSVLACRRLLGQTQSVIYVATSGYHMLRCVLLLRLVGLRARPAHSVPQVASRNSSKRWFWRLREVPAIPVDSALLLLRRLRNRL